MSKLAVNVGILEAECRESAEACDDLIERLKECMKRAQNHWMIVDEEEQFQAAIGVVIMHSSEDEIDLIKASLKPHQALQAASNGLPVDWKALLEESDGMELIPIPKIWHEIKES